MSDNQKANSESISGEQATEKESRIPQQSRRQLLGKLRQAAIAIPVATALALKPETAYPY